MYAYMGLIKNVAWFYEQFKVFAMKFRREVNTLYDFGTAAKPRQKFQCHGGAVMGELRHSLRVRVRARAETFPRAQEHSV